MGAWAAVERARIILLGVIHALTGRGHNVATYYVKDRVSSGLYGRVRSTQTLVIHQWAGPSVIAKLAPDSTPDRAE